MAASGGTGARSRASLARKARELAVREGLFPPGCRVLVMVSGGQDSLALVDILAGLRSRPGGPAAVHALHVNHHLRGPDSDADEALVAAVCVDLGVALTVAHEAIVKAGGNVQERAREARRQAALAVAAAQRCDRIALGHTADDQAETMLYRLGRYGGLAAFRAMLPCEPPWVRPLLEARRAQTAEYCRARGLSFAQDRGNAYPGYARTALREVVLPAWEAALPGAVEAAARAAAVAAEMERLAESMLAEAERGVFLRPGPAAAASSEGAGKAGAGVDARAARSGSVALSVAGLLSLELPLRRLLLHRWLEGRARPAASRASVLALESLLLTPGSAERNLGGGWRGVKAYDELWLANGPQAPRAAAAPAKLTFPGRVVWGEVWVSAEPAERFLAPDISREAFVDARSVAGELQIRGPRPGDRMRPLGAPGTRKLQDIFVDLRVPRVARATTPLLVCDGRIVWVCGLLIAEEGRITAETTAIVRVAMGRLGCQVALGGAGAAEGDGHR